MREGRIQRIRGDMVLITRCDIFPDILKFFRALMGFIHAIIDPAA
jgi:hypothetical protein